MSLECQMNSLLGSICGGLLTDPFGYPGGGGGVTTG